MKIEARAELVINGEAVTYRQLEVLESVKRTGSMASAARDMGISVPVVHRYISNIEAAAGEPVTLSTPMGTDLTDAGRRICRLFARTNFRCREERGYCICCSPVMSDLVNSVLTTSGIRHAEVVVSDDEHNIRMMAQGTADMAVIDDPLYVYETDGYGFESDEVANLGMVFADRGDSFIRYRYGAQRVAFMYLDTLKRRYTVDSEAYSLTEMLGSGKSFFVDEVLLLKRGLRIRSAADTSVLRHVVTAVFDPSDRNAARIVTALKRRNGMRSPGNGGISRMFQDNLIRYSITVRTVLH